MDIDDNVEDVDSMENVVKRSLLAKNKLAIIVKLPNGETQFCCVQCPVRSYSKEELELHLLAAHIDEYRHLCAVCGTGLKRKEHMERHMFEHQQVRSHVCEICNKAFKRKEHLNIHRSIHSGDKSEVCVLCHKSFYRKDHLQKHLQTHGKHLAEQGMYILSEQELMNIKAEAVDPEGSDGSQGELSMGSPAEEYVDGDMQESMESIECNVNIGISNNEVVLPKDRPHACHLCDKTYKRKDHLKLHLQTHQKKDKVCNECGKAFHRQDQLLAHMGTHLNSYSAINKLDEDDKETLQNFLASQEMEPINFMPEEDNLLVPRQMGPPSVLGDRRHECEVCHRKFKRRQHLKVHYNVHTKSQPPNIWCSKCSQGFYSNTDFESHQCVSLIQENNDGSPQQDAKKENEYPLEIIPIEEPKLDDSQYIHDESAIPTPRIVYVCKYCSKPFKRKDHYKIHLHIHTGIKSFFCPDCGKGFYRKDHLQKHIQVHTKPKVKPKKAVPGLVPINMLAKKEIKPEITIHAPSNTKLRVPLQIKVPYQVVMSMDNGEQHAVTVDPQSSTSHELVT